MCDITLEGAITLANLLEYKTDSGQLRDILSCLVTYHVWLQAVQETLVFLSKI